MNDWISVTCQRDLLQFQGIKPDIELAEGILRTIPTLEEPDVASLARRLGKSSHLILKNLKLLEQLFVVQSLRPHPLGTGKTRYFLCDAGLVHLMRGDYRQQLATWLLVEQVSQRNCRGEFLTQFYYYRGTRGGIIDLVVEHRDHSLTAYKVIDKESLDLRNLEILISFGMKCDQAKIAHELIALGPFKETCFVKGIRLAPLESVV